METVADDTKAPNREAEAKPGFSFPNPSGKDWSREEEKETPKPDAKAPARRGRPPKANLETALTQQFAMVGTLVYAFDSYDGSVILKNSPELAKSLNELAKENPAVRKALESLVTASVWSGVAMSGAAIAVPIMANHGMMPGGLATLFGAPDPKTVKEDAPRE